MTTTPNRENITTVGIVERRSPLGPALENYTFLTT